MRDPTVASRTRRGERHVLADVLPRCGTFAAGTPASALPQSTRERARLQIASTIAALIAADRDEGARRLTAWARRSVGPHPLLPTRIGVGRVEAIVAGVGRARALSWDDYALVGRAGSAALVVPMVLGAPGDLAWSEVEAAHAVATELALRFGLASADAIMLAPHPLDDAPCVSAIGGAVAAARVLRLDAAQTAEALALALAAPQLTVFGTRGAMAAGTTVFGGVLAAELAFEGALGLERLSTLVRGGGTREGDDDLELALGAFEALGDAWLVETIHPKEHAAPAAAQTAIDAAREVRAQAHAIRGRALLSSDVTRVDIDTTILGAARSVRDALVRATCAALVSEPLSGEIVPRTHVRHAWDLTSALVHRVATALDPGALFGRSWRGVVLAPLRMRRVLAALGVEAPSLADAATEIGKLLAAPPPFQGAFDPRALSLPLATRLTVTLADGTRLASDCAFARGAPGSRDAVAMVRRKLCDAAHASLGRRRAERLFDMIMDPSPRLRISQMLAAMSREPAG